MNEELNLEMANECAEEVCEAATTTIGKRGLIALGVTAVVGVITAIAIKNREKLNDWMKTHLTKKGYAVIDPLDDIDCGEIISTESNEN